MGTRKNREVEGKGEAQRMSEAEALEEADLEILYYQLFL